jgi:uncharacterized membrane-anchored protein
MFKTLLASLLLMTLGVASAAPALDEEKLLSSLNFQQGKVSLPGNIATLDLPPAFRYLSPADASKVLEQGWGNPPGSKTLGMIVPAAVSVLSAEGWGVVVTYDKDGHVKDGDADSIDYSKLLKEMQEGTSERNEERKKAGYPAMSMVGWAEPPSYNKSQHKLYWAQELHTEGSQGNGLNYNIRVLGREGVLVLNAVAGMDQIALIKQEMPSVTAFTEFTPGNRYSDFNESTDKVAEYGLAALVAGGVAAKMGFFGKLLAILLAAKKFLILGVAAAGTWIAKLFGKKSDKVDLSKQGD